MIWDHALDNVVLPTKIDLSNLKYLGENRYPSLDLPKQIEKLLINA